MFRLFTRTERLVATGTNWVVGAVGVGGDRVPGSHSVCFPGVETKCKTPLVQVPSFLY